MCHCRKGMRLLTFTLVVLSLIASAPAASADVLELKTGERLEGTFKQASVPGGIVIEVGGQVITMPFAKVRAIYFGAAPTAAPAGSASTVSAAQALDALMELKDVTSSGLNYRDYSQRVLDVKIRVSRYLRGGAESPVKSAFAAALHYYELSSRAWALVALPSSAVSLDQEGVIRVELQSDGCKLLQTFITKTGQPTLVSYLIGQQPGILWSCAKDKISEAEQLLAGKPPETIKPVATPTPAPVITPEPVKKPETFTIQGGRKN
jgi:hypothetical protein